MAMSQPNMPSFVEHSDCGLLSVSDDHERYSFQRDYFGLAKSVTDNKKPQLPMKVTGVLQHLIFTEYRHTVKNLGCQRTSWNTRKQKTRVLSMKNAGFKMMRYCMKRVIGAEAGIENGMDKGVSADTHFFTVKVTASGICWHC